MKFLIIFLIFVTFFGSWFFANSNAQSTPPSPREDPSFLDISSQIQIRNSEGILVAYIEPSNFYLNNVYLLNQFLDELSQGNKKTVTIDGNSYEQIEFGFFHVEGGTGQRASYDIWQSGFPVLTLKFSGYLAEPGHTATINMKIIRTI